MLFGTKWSVMYVSIHILVCLSSGGEATRYLMVQKAPSEHWNVAELFGRCLGTGGYIL